MNFVLTNAGAQAFVNAEQNGVSNIKISHVAFGSGKNPATKTQNALQSEIKRLPIISGGKALDGSIHIAVQDTSGESFSAYEVGVYLENGILLCVCSQAEEPILQKTFNAVAQFEIGIKFENVNAENITFGNTEFSSPAATTENAGIVELATAEETKTGLDDRRAVTPAALAELKAAENLAGLTKFATEQEAQTATEKNKALTPFLASVFFASKTATAAEIKEGKENGKFVTPALLKTALEEYQPGAATENEAGIVELATAEETKAGTTTNKAVTPAGLKAAQENYTGPINTASVTPTGATTKRTIANKLSDFITPLDFGAKGDGSTNDTAAFTSLESKVKGADISLVGKTYSVTALPNGNRYYNGFFKFNGVTYAAIYDFFRGGLVQDFLNPKRDFSEFTRGGGALIAGNFKAAGSGAGNVVQSFIADNVNRYFYAQFITGAGNAVINRFPMTELGGDEIKADAYSLPSEYIGHQGLGIEYRTGGGVKLWGSIAWAEVGTANIYSRGTKACRFNPPTGEGTNVDSGIEIFNLFPENADSSQAVTTAISYSGKYLIAKMNESGNAFKVRVFRLADFTAAGDYSKKYIHEFTINLTRDISGGTERALQGMACDDRYIYFLATGTGYDEKHSIYITDLLGNLVHELRDFELGKEIGRAVGTTFYEPESLFFMELNGAPRLCIQIATGDTTGSRLCHVIAINARQSWFFATGSSAGDFGGVAIDNAARLINTEGAGVLSLYPSGRSQDTIARAGTAQKALARFSDDTAGANISVLKSRGAKVKQSKSVLPGDTISTWSFLADNGKLDYNGSAVGARVAYIVADVAEDSTASAAGNSNVGIKGVLRLLVCEDSETSRNGRGLYLTTAGFLPSHDNALNLGSGSRRLKEIFAGTGTITTSDENLKTEIEEIPAAVFEAWGKVNFNLFKFKDAVEAKGNQARKHIGLIAQRVVKAFESVGLNAFDFGLICKENDGEKDILFLRYDECLALECAYMRYKLNELGGV